MYYSSVRCVASVRKRTEDCTPDDIPCLSLYGYYCTPDCWERYYVRGTQSFCPSFAVLKQIRNIGNVNEEVGALIEIGSTHLYRRRTVLRPHDEATAAVGEWAGGARGVRRRRGLGSTQVAFPVYVNLNCSHVLRYQIYSLTEIPPDEQLLVGCASTPLFFPHPLRQSCLTSQRRSRAFDRERCIAPSGEGQTQSCSLRVSGKPIRD